MLAGDLPLWRWDAAKDDFVRDVPDIDPEIAAGMPGGVFEVDGMSREEFDSVIGPERFRWALCQVSGVASRITKVPEAQINENDSQFVAASDVVYRRVMESPLGARIMRLPARDLVDILVVGSFAVPYLLSVSKGIAARKKKAAVAETPSEGVSEK